MNEENSNLQVSSYSDGVNGNCTKLAVLPRYHLISGNEMYFIKNRLSTFFTLGVPGGGVELVL